MDLLEVANKRSVPGILIFNHLKLPVFSNPEAVGILSKLNGSKPVSSSKVFGIEIPQEISNLYDNLTKNYDSSSAGPVTEIPTLITLFTTHNTTYCCRGFFLDAQANSPRKTYHVMMLIEKVSQHRELDLEKFKKRFTLTDRQMEIIKQLFAGSTNKEIADRLCVSEDTIKGHLKIVMRRLGVKTRTEILSMLLQL